MLHSLEEKEVYGSAGSACSSNKPAPSKTLQGIGLKKADLEGTIRFSFCVNTTEAEIDYAIEQLDVYKRQAQCDKESNGGLEKR